jgi:hypothetical protein
MSKKLRAASGVIGLCLCVVVAGCSGNVREIGSTGALDKRPLAERIVTKPAEVKSETPQTLAQQGLALVVARVYSEKADTGFMGLGEKKTSRVGVLLTLGATDKTAKLSTMLFGQEASGSESAVGWAITVAKPGKYYIANMGGAAGYPSIHRTNMGYEFAEALGQTTEIKAGEVVYLGSVRSRVDGKEVGLTVGDETADAKAYLHRELPSFAAVMTTRLLDCGCNARRNPEETARRLIEQLAKTKPPEKAAEVVKR